jgi:hypothetical protein
MEDLTTKDHINLFPVPISDVRVEQLLGSSEFLSGTGEAQATVVIGSLEEWSNIDQVVARCFDTTASNTDPYSGACTVIEQKLGRNLLFLGCRHHIIELVIGAAFETTCDASSGSAILLYKRFKEHWQNIDPENQLQQTIQWKHWSNQPEMISFASLCST